MEARALGGRSSGTQRGGDGGACAKLQIEVQTARSTAEGIEALQADPNFHVVISDWGRAWEWEAGLRLLSRVHELRPSLPVIFYHGETDEAARAERAERLRAAGAFGEAVYPAELFTLVLRALQGYRHLANRTTDPPASR